VLNDRCGVVQIYGGLVDIASLLCCAVLTLHNLPSNHFARESEKVIRTDLRFFAMKYGYESKGQSNISVNLLLLSSKYE
jgi:hypothetical protein